MANEWLRLWHDMPTDPKWRTISRVAGEPVALVQAVYLHMLVDASRNVTRGHVDVTTEDLASALDVTEAQIASVLRAMEHRVLVDGVLTGWERRQPKKEDSGNTSTEAKTPAQRKRDQRERESSSRDVTESHDESRNVTLDKDKDKDKEDTPVAPKGAEPDGFANFWSVYPNHKAKSNAVKAWGKVPATLHPSIFAAVAVQSKSKDWAKDGGQYVPHAATWLNGKRWEDTPAQTSAHAPEWLAGTDFSDVFEANNAGCYAHNVSKFRQGAAA